MADVPFYRPLTEDLAQGDIFEDVPHVHSRRPIEVVRQVDPQKTPGRRMFGLYPWPPNPGEQPALPKPGILGGKFSLHPPEGELVASHCEVTRTIALNHECDLVVRQEPKYRLVAMILPLRTTVQDKPVTLPDGSTKQLWDVIRDNQNYHRFYLPSGPGILDESYVEIRRVSCVHPDFLDPSKRISALSEVAFKSLMKQIFLYFTHKELRDDML